MVASTITATPRIAIAPLTRDIQISNLPMRRP
jgi:hypothetical protein